MNYLKMSKEELLNLGFRRWNKETGLMLIPGALFQDVLSSLPVGTELTDILGNKQKIGDGEFDDDTRAGLTAWGWIV